MPIPPIHSSFAWVVVGVVPVTAAVLLAVALAIWSSGPADRMPLYSITTAAEMSEAWVMVMPVVPLEAFGPCQISVVVPPVLVACETRDQVTPPPLMPETRLALVPRVEITAIRVFPATGPVVRFTLKVVLTLEPVLSVALCTRTGVAEPVRNACDPTSLAARLVLPVRVRSSPLTLLEIVRLAAVASAVAS